jgi:hypothetical protein
MQKGQGVVQLIGELVAHDLSVPPYNVNRRKILVGVRENGEEVSVPANGLNVLLTGSSGSGKSTLATGIFERVTELGYQMCVIDPEGDYEGITAAVMFGTPQRGPAVTEILTALDSPDTNVIANLVGLPLQDRPAFFLALLPALQERRATFGRPHWILSRRNAPSATPRMASSTSRYVARPDRHGLCHRTSRSCRKTGT